MGNIVQYRDGLNRRCYILETKNHRQLILNLDDGTYPFMVRITGDARKDVLFARRAEAEDFFKNGVKF